ncbi:MAG: hypothetical protein H6730_32620 [Deltaproteobacteria bacterium]|nr:hypothetical protein [Deltaproteobacteria bacterium]
MKELETLAQLEAHVAAGLPFQDVVLQGLDLTAAVPRLMQADLRGAAFLGCEMPAGLRERALNAGALVFPPLPGLPYHPYRAALYTAEELYGGFDPDQPGTYPQTLDARVYAHWHRTQGPSPDSILETLARRLHDHAITDALEETIAGRRVIAIMGGHGLSRAEPGYAEVARISRALTRKGAFMASGGGPGAMEATHLGAFLATVDDDALGPAQALLAEAPRYSDPGWLAQAFRVMARHPYQGAEDRAARASLGIPTWLYGHEPPAPFATHIAKYFANSVREDGLLTIARGGVVFSPGSAGTIQEVFQDACQNHYETPGVASPMIFLGVEYWTRTKPVYPLLVALAEGKPYAQWLRITDDPDEVVEVLEAYAAR